MKRLNLLIFKSFIGPFIVTFCITIFVLLMQFLFKYVDDLVGKGLDVFIIFKLLFWASFSFVPLALPLAILISSLMTFGSMGEHYELVAFKSAGISFQRILAPMLYIILFLGVGAFFFSNNVIPFANLKMSSLLYDVRQQKPTFALKEGVFYNGFDGYSIRAGKKDKESQTLYNLMIYDHSADKGNTNVLIADKGKMYKSNDERYLIIKLYNGESYREDGSKNNDYDRRQHTRIKFAEHEVKFDLSTFQLNRTNEELFKDHYSLLNISQLQAAEKDLDKELENTQKYFRVSLYPYISILDSNKNWDKVKPAKDSLSQDTFLQNFSLPERSRIIDRSKGLVRNVKNYVEASVSEQNRTEELIRRHQIEWHRKFTLPVACLILFLIGAPLGSIIRKGGLGVPIVISIFFFIFFHILSTSGEKYVREGIINSFQGMWLATMVLAPVGIFLLRKASRDSVIFDADVYLNGFKKILKFFKLIN